MRIDLGLKYLCLAKSRSIVKSLCDKQALRINGKPAKPSSSLHAGDRVVLALRSKTLFVRIIDVPPKQLSKATARSYYDIESVEVDDD